MLRPRGIFAADAILALQQVAVDIEEVGAHLLSDVSQASSMSVPTSRPLTAFEATVPITFASPVCGDASRATAANRRARIRWPPATGSTVSAPGRGQIAAIASTKPL